jgi:Domain of unknown function (DUF4338)
MEERLNRRSGEGLSPCPGSAGFTIDTSAEQPKLFGSREGTSRDDSSAMRLSPRGRVSRTSSAPLVSGLPTTVFNRSSPALRASATTPFDPDRVFSNDRYAAARRRNIGFLAHNTRFLILPLVEVRHLASHILSCIARRLPQDREELCRHPVYYLETSVDPGRFRGTCYPAANWLVLGLSTGVAKTTKQNSYAGDRSINSCGFSYSGLRQATIMTSSL